MKRFFIVLTIIFVGVLVSGCRNDEETLVVGLECNYPPFNWTTMTTNEHTVKIADVVGYADGYDIVMARRIAEELGYKLVIKKLPWEGLIEALNSGMIDLIIAGMSPTAERKENIDFTEPYYISKQCIVVRTDSAYANATSIADFNGAKMIAQNGTLQNDLIDQITGSTRLAPRNSYPELFIALEAGVADGVIAEDPVAKLYANNNPAFKVITFSEGNGFNVTLEQEAVSIGLKKGNQELANQINEVLASISDQERDAWMQAAANRYLALNPSGE